MRGVKHGREALRAMVQVNNVSAYARRLGVVPPSYHAVVAEAMRLATGYRPTLRAVGEAVERIRIVQWNNAKASFAAAHAARVWAYRMDPEQTVMESERVRLAWRRFERARRKPEAGTPADW